MKPLDADALAALLAPGCVIGREIQVYKEAGSTNDTAAWAGVAGAREGLVILAESQRAGRGRQGRRWESAPGAGLWFSVLLRPPARFLQYRQQLALWAALAVAEAIEARAGGTALEVKWPNDVVAGGRKLAGILIEARGDFVVAGIGVNVNHRIEDFPVELRERAGSVAMAAEHEVDRAELAGDLLRRLDALYAGWPGNCAEIAGQCNRRSYLNGREVEVGSLHAGGSAMVGIVQGMDQDGALLVRERESGLLHRICSGEVNPVQARA